MKSLRFGLVVIVTLCTLIVLSDAALARTHVSVGIGVGYPGFYAGYGHGWGWRHHSHDSIFICGYWPVYEPYYYYPGPGYYVVEPPPVVVQRPPVVVENPAPVVQPRTVDASTQKLFNDLRNKKSELLHKLAIGDKAQRKNALNELTGFSFDDNVRQAIENVLLSDPDSELRIEAAHAFGEVKNNEALPALKKARVNDSDPGVRQEADNSISRIEGNAS